jgi:thiol-disulfide isomerase/thioredoxin
MPVPAPKPVIAAIVLTSIIVAVALTPGCSTDKADPYVGNMLDFSYANRRDKEYGPSANGHTLRMADYKGHFVWIDFAAPWCSPCQRQAPVIRNLEKDYGERIIFLTMMTTDASGRGPANTHTARQWARQHHLDPSRVVPTGERARTIPQHLLFSPLGQTLEWRIGLMSDADIRAVLAQHTREWNRWYQENKDSPSVIMSEIGDLSR